MAKIVKPGNGIEYKFSGTTKCSNCGCTFEYDASEVKEDEEEHQYFSGINRNGYLLGGGGTYKSIVYHVTCPDCGRETKIRPKRVYTDKDKKSMVIDGVFNFICLIAISIVLICQHFLYGGIALSILGVADFGLSLYYLTPKHKNYLWGLILSIICMCAIMASIGLILASCCDELPR